MPVTAADLRTYVVNLPRRGDRRRRMQETLPHELNAVYTSDWRNTFDGHELTRGGLEAAGYRLFPWRISSGNPWWSRPLKLGEIGCTIAHISCWNDAAANTGEPYILVLEDDAVLTPGFLPALLHQIDQIEVPFGLMYLGRFPLEPDRPVAPGLVSPGYSHCTFGYLLTRSALKAVLALRLDQAIVPVDEFLPCLYVDHPRTDLRRRFPRQFAALAFEPPLVTQLPKEQAGSDTEASDFVT